VFIEIKTQTGTQSPEQKQWQALIESIGHCYELVRNLADFEKVVKKFYNFS